MRLPRPPAVATIDLDALSRNLAAIRARLPRGTGVLAVVKANAYGHGAVPVARRLVREGAEWLGVANAAEGIELREAGIQRPVLVLSFFPPADAPLFVERRLTPAVGSIEQARALDRALGRAGREGGYHLKIDTGMGRLGVPPGGLAPFLEAARRLPRARLDGVMTHLSSAEDPSAEAVAFTLDQLRRFREALATITARGFTPRLRHAANSAAILFHPQADLNLARPGIALYGAYPHPRARAIARLEPVLTLATTVLRVVEVPPATPLSYGRTFRTTRPSRIATLAAGYADGFRRALSNRGEILIRGRRAPVVGTVTMDMILADVTEIPEARTGDEAVLIGRQAGAEIRAEEIAERLGTIAYEVFCSIGRRVPRVPFRHPSRRSLSTPVRPAR